MNPSYMSDMYDSEPRRKNTQHRRPGCKEHTQEIVPRSRLRRSRDADIRGIPNYSLRFSPVVRQQAVKDVEGYVVVTRETLTPLVTFFSKQRPSEYIPYVLSSLKYLIETYNVLNEYNIIHTNYTSIAFRPNSTPVLCDFVERSLVPYYIPIELYMLNTVAHSNIRALSKQNIEGICLKYFKLIGKKVSDESMRSCVSFFTPIVNRPSSEATDLLGRYQKTWHIYGLASVYIQLLGILDVPCVPRFLSTLLLRCVSLLPPERPDASELIHSLNTNREV